MFYVYILYSQRLDKYYIGSTNNIDRRLKDHNRGKTAFTKTGIPWELKASEAYATRAEAVQRENQLKRQKSRLALEKIIR